MDTKANELRILDEINKLAELRKPFTSENTQKQGNRLLLMSAVLLLLSLSIVTTDGELGISNVKLKFSTTKNIIAVGIPVCIYFLLIYLFSIRQDLFFFQLNNALIFFQNQNQDHLVTHQMSDVERKHAEVKEKTDLRYERQNEMRAYIKKLYDDNIADATTVEYWNTELAIADKERKLEDELENGSEQQTLKILQKELAYLRQQLEKSIEHHRDFVRRYKKASNVNLWRRRIEILFPTILGLAAILLSVAFMITNKPTP